LPFRFDLFERVRGHRAAILPRSAVPVCRSNNGDGSILGGK
jgi:hypothetical protein